jgi:hypothetical protein
MQSYKKETRFQIQINKNKQLTIAKPMQTGINCYK